MHGDRDVAQHRFRPGGGDDHVACAGGERIADVPELAVLLLGFDFEIGDSGLQHGIPVDQPLAAVDEALIKEPHEHLGHHLREPLVHGEALALPVAGGAEPAHLARDRRARFLFPLPYPLDERVTPDVAARGAFRFELALDHDLRGDAGVVGARLPQRVVTAHAVIAGERVHQRLLERVPHVQRPGDVGRRQQDAVVVGIPLVEAGLEIAAVLPDRIPARLDRRRLETLGELHVGRGGG